jgi:hypothetical protein
MRRVTLEVVAIGVALVVGVGIGAAVTRHAGSASFLGGTKPTPRITHPTHAGGDRSPATSARGMNGTPTVDPGTQATAVASFCGHTEHFPSIDRDIKAKHYYQASRKLGSLSVAFQTDADLFDAAGDHATGNWLRGAAGFIARPESLPDLFQMEAFYKQRCNELRRGLS